MFEFSLQASEGAARSGVFETPHGDVLTPTFMPVGTQGTVKMLTSRQVRAAGARARRIGLARRRHGDRRGDGARGLRSDRRRGRPAASPASPARCSALWHLDYPSYLSIIRASASTVEPVRATLGSLAYRYVYRRTSIARIGVDLKQLEAFLAVATHRSFSRAAGALQLTQPSVTARIQSLERDLGEPVFQRNGRGVSLTEVGESFLPHAQRVLKALHDGHDAVQSLRQGDTGTLRLGAAPTFSTYVLPELLTTFRSRYPGMEVSVRTEYSDQIVQMVLADEVQMGLERTITHPEVVTIPLYEDEVVLVASGKDEFAARSSVGVEEIGEHRLIMFNRGSSYYTLVGDALRQAGVSVSPAMELDNMEAAKKMVEEGLGIAILPMVAVSSELERGDLRQVQVVGLKMPRRQIALIYRRGRPLSRAARAFIELLEQRYGVQALGGAGDSGC
ncbi:MAG: LysR family transcriptional regulator [Chloroflexi bacterium]|nr:LysR family transcriptional regulator [Chloroflexota bacterium]